MNGGMHIGFSQRVRLEWLERTAALVLAGGSREGIEGALQGLLRDQISVGGNAERGNREKAISILLRTWVIAPESLAPLRDEGLQLLAELPPEEHLPVHWGMTMAAYPFFGAVAEVVGRLLRLQGSVPAAQAQRRIRERLGERETVARAARRVLRCFVDWRVLEDTADKGIYRPAPVRPLQNRKLAAWLLEATLQASQTGSAPLRAIAQAPSLFPFDLGSLGPAIIQESERLELFRQGLDEEVVLLRGAANGGCIRRP